MKNYELLKALLLENNILNNENVVFRASLDSSGKNLTEQALGLIPQILGEKGLKAYQNELDINEAIKELKIDEAENFKNFIENIFSDIELNELKMIISSWSKLYEYFLK